MSTAKSHRPSLGRGLSALISTAPAVPVFAQGNTQPDPGPPAPIRIVETPAVPPREESVATEKADAGQSVSFIEMSSIVANPNQPRREFKAEELEDLARSVRDLGVLQPVLLRPLDSFEDKRSYEIVAGERRWRAAQKAGLEKIPAIVRTLSDREALEIAIVENVQRENLNPIEEARAYERLANEFSLSHAQVAERVGKDRSSIANMLRLLRLPSDLIPLVADGKLSVGHAKAILSVREPAAQLSLAKKVMNENLSVRDLETIVARVVVLDTGKSAQAKTGKGATRKLPGNFGEVEDDLRRALGTRVAIKHKASGRGRIEIEYFSEDELSRVVELLKGM